MTEGKNESSRPWNAYGARTNVKLGDPLTARESRVAALMSLGYIDAKIATRLGEPFGVVTRDTINKDVKYACIKTGRGRNGLVMWILDHTNPERRAQMVEAAERHRDRLVASGFLTPQCVQIARLLVDLEHCEKSFDELGKLVTPQIGRQRANRYASDMWGEIGSNGCRAKLVAVLHLAPLPYNR